MIIDEKLLVKVTNREKGTVGYTVADLGIKRNYQPGETKEVTYEELEKLMWTPGGSYILKNCLVIHNEDVVKELLGEVEPEYYYSEKNIIEIMKNGTLDEFLDCLDFAPDGVKTLIKEYAVSLPLNDVEKRNAIKNKLNFDVTGAIELLKADEKEETEEQQPKRRAATTGTKSSGTTVRRVVKTVKKEEK